MGMNSLCKNETEKKHIEKKFLFLFRVSFFPFFQIILIFISNRKEILYDKVI